MVVKDRNTKVENSSKKKLLLVLLVVNIFLFAIVIIPMLQLTQTVITKKPIAHAATCQVCGYDMDGQYYCGQAECNGTCGSDGICGSNCADPNAPGCGDAACDGLGSCDGGSASGYSEASCVGYWNCSTATRSIGCSQNIQNCGAINGQCGGSAGECFIGDSSGAANNGSGTAWSCYGQNGGTTAGCYIANDSGTTKYTCSGTSCIVDSTGTSAVTDPNCNGGCGTPDSGTINYSCSDGNCNVDSSGPYSDAGCNSECGITNNTYYDCSGGLCMVNFNGQYTSPNCNNQCGIPQTKYSCNPSGNCVIDANGQYTTSNCNNQCSTSSLLAQYSNLLLLAI